MKHLRTGEMTLGAFQLQIYGAGDVVLIGRFTELDLQPADCALAVYRNEAGAEGQVH